MHLCFTLRSILTEFDLKLFYTENKWIHCGRAFLKSTALLGTWHSTCGFSQEYAMTMSLWKFTQSTSTPFWGNTNDSTSFTCQSFSKCNFFVSLKCEATNVCCVSIIMCIITQFLLSSAIFCKSWSDPHRHWCSCMAGAGWRSLSDGESRGKCNHNFWQQCIYD